MDHEFSFQSRDGIREKKVSWESNNELLVSRHLTEHYSTLKDIVMGESRHDEKACTCVQYKADFTQYDLRYVKDSRYCKICKRHISLKKWKGGLVKFCNRSKIVTQEFCPCCGERLRSGRRAKAVIRRSVTDQLINPQNYNIAVIKKLNKKAKYLQKIKMIQIKK